MELFLDMLRNIFPSVRTTKPVASDIIEESNNPNYILLVAAWFGLLTGLGESAGFVLRKYALGRIIRLGPNSIWMIPMADFVLFLIVGMILWLVARWWHRLNSLRIISMIFTFFGFMSLLSLTSRVSELASTLLSLGLALQLSYLIDSHKVLFLKLARITMVWMRGIVVLLTVSILVVKP